jgi:hypothetical protein
MVDGGGDRGRERVSGIKLIWWGREATGWFGQVGGGFRLQLERRAISLAYAFFPVHPSGRYCAFFVNARSTDFLH